MAIYTPSAIYNPQFVNSSAAALVFAPTSAAGGSVVPAKYQYRIDSFYVANTGTVIGELQIWRVPATFAADTQHVIVPAINIPIGAITTPWLAIAPLFGAVLGAGDAVWAQCTTSGSQISISADGLVIVQ